MAPDDTFSKLFGAGPSAGQPGQPIGKQKQPARRYLVSRNPSNNEKVPFEIAINGTRHTVLVGEPCELTDGAVELLRNAGVGCEPVE